MVEGWASALKMQFDLLNQEIKPRFASIVSPAETVVVSRFHIELDGGDEVHVNSSLGGFLYQLWKPIRCC